MHSFRTYTQRFLVLLIALQIISSGLFVQDFSNQSTNANAITFFSSYTHSNKTAKHSPKQQKHRTRILKKSTLKYLSFSIHKVKKTEKDLTPFAGIYSNKLPCFYKNIIPPPPKA